MVKREIGYFYYLIKAYKLLFIIPFFITIFIIIENKLQMNTLGAGSIILLLFPFIILPSIAVLDFIGSLDQKELFITYAVSPFLVGFVRPLIIGVSGSFLFTIIVAVYIDREIAVSSFCSVLLYFSITSFLISLFKHNGFGLVISLFYFFFGFFTTGMGQGSLYLVQWYRPKMHTDVNDFIFIQLAVAIFLYFLTYICVKYRNYFHLIKD